MGWRARHQQRHGLSSQPSGRTAVSSTARTRRRPEAGERTDPLALEELISELSSGFVRIAPREVDAEIDRWLGRLANFLEVDRTSMTQMSSDGRSLHVTHSYSVEGIPAFPTIILDTELPWYVEQVRKGLVLRLERLPEGLPLGAQAERAHATRTGFKSHLMLPFTVGGSTLGGIGFGVYRQYRAWPDHLVKRLQLVSEVVGNALARKRAWQSLEGQLAFERLVTDLVKAFASVPAEQLDGEIQNGLGRLVKHFGTDQSVLVRLPAEGFRLSTIHSAPCRWEPFLGDTVDFPWYVRQLRKGRPLQLSRIPADLPVEAAVELRHWCRVGLQSHLSIPLVTGDRTWGAIGFAAFLKARRWSDEEVQCLQLVGEVMMGALMRREANEAAIQRRAEPAQVARVAAVGELTAALVHELNQPLAAIRINAQATRRLLATGHRLEDLDEALGDIVSDAVRAANLIRDFVIF
jgi:GAF domain-containing protein